MPDMNNSALPSHVVCDGARILFDIIDGDEQIECAISRAALEDISESRCFKPAQMLAIFNGAQARITAVALMKRKARPGPLEGRLNIWADDMDLLEENADPATPEARQSA